MDNYAGQHKLIEGEWYNFKIIKQIEFENEGYFILETPFKSRITIPSEPYKNYCFKIGEEVLCKVDKISCSGKIYFEPEHPYYKVDNAYSFEYVDFKEIKSLYGGSLFVVYFKDKLNNLIEIPAWKTISEMEPYQYLKVIRIKKAHVTAYPVDSPYISKYENNQKLKLTFVEKFQNQYGEIEYLAHDQFHFWCIIPAKYFNSIEIPKNSFLNAIAVKHPTNNYFYIEPEHPLYQRNGLYPFVVKEVQINHNILNDIGLPELNITVKDSIFDNYKLVAFNENPPKVGEKIMLITLGIRKGILHLQFPK